MYFGADGEFGRARFWLMEENRDAVASHYKGRNPFSSVIPDTNHLEVRISLTIEFEAGNVFTSVIEEVAGLTGRGGEGCPIGHSG